MINAKGMKLMKKTLLRFGLGLCLLTPTFAQSAWAAGDINKTDINQMMTTFMQQKEVPGAAVTIYDNGKTQTFVYGVTNKNTKKPVTVNTIFEVGSITKLMTTLLIAESASKIVHYQASEGVPPQLKLEGTLPTYLSAYAQNPAYNKITLLNLATFSASLPFSLPANITTDTQIFSYLNAWKPSYPVGTQYQYSNASIGLLGAVLQSQYHQPIAAIFQQMIFNPLHMHSTGLLLPSSQQAKLAQGYNDAGTAVPASQFGPFPSAGDLKSSISDMSRFLAAAVGAPGTDPEIHIGMQVAQTPRAKLPDGMLQGMAWQVYPLDSQAIQRVPKEMDLGPEPITWLPTKQQQFQTKALIDKTGATSGFRAYIAVIPSAQKGVVILMNRYVSNGDIVNLGRKILMQEQSTAKG